MITIYEQRGIAKGIEQGIERGVLRAKHDVLLRLARLKFPSLSPEIAARLESLETVAELDAALERVLTATAPEELLTP